MRLSGILFLLIGFAVMIGCSDSVITQKESIDAEAVKKEIAIARDGFFKAWKNGDAEHIILYLSGEDFVSMPTLDLTEDLQSIIKAIHDISENYTVEELEYKQTEIFLHSEMAYEIGWLHDLLIDRESGEKIKGHQRTLMVWKKVNDGTWKLHRWMFQE